MPFIAIKGRFFIQGYSPDGDSIRFHADDTTRWAQLSGPSVDLNGRQHAQLRIEAIDTLETHYKSQHQPPQFADDATESLFNSLGLTNVQWNANRTRVVAADDGAIGFILTRKTEMYGRPVSFLFPGDQYDFSDGDSVFLDINLLRQSVNYQQIDRGLAYPTFYDGLFHDLRADLADATGDARRVDVGLWDGDVSNNGFDVPALSAITQDNVILPKLFRRLVSYMEGGGAVNGFKQYLEQRPERVMLVENAHITNFDNLIEQNGINIRLNTEPEKMVFLN